MEWTVEMMMNFMEYVRNTYKATTILSFNIKADRMSFLDESGAVNIIILSKVYQKMVDNQ